MKRSLIIVSILLLLVACEVQKPEEEYLSEIQSAENQADKISTYRKLVKYYPDSDNIQTYRLSLIDLLLENQESPQEIENLVGYIENDTTKILYTYRLMELYNSEGNAQCTQRLENSFSSENLILLGKKLIADQKYEQSVEVLKSYTEKYPDGPEADKAYFLIGFTYSENLNKKDEAKKYFEVIPEKYPDSELADDAEWMVLNMDKEEITFITDDKQDQ